MSVVTLNSKYQLVLPEGWKRKMAPGEWSWPRWTRTGPN